MSEGTFCGRTMGFRVTEGPAQEESSRMQCALLMMAILVFLTPIIGCGQETKSDLVVLDSKAFGDSDLSMSAKELERKKNTSTIKVVRVKGKSVPSSMFVARAIYEIANARKCEYFINLKEWTDKDGSRIYVAGFTNTKDADLKKEFGEQYDYENEYGQKRGYMSVSEFDLLFKPRPKQTDSEILSASGVEQTDLSVSSLIAASPQIKQKQIVEIPIPIRGQIEVTTGDPL